MATNLLECTVKYSGVFSWGFGQSETYFEQFIIHSLSEISCGHRKRSKTIKLRLNNYILHLLLITAETCCRKIKYTFILFIFVLIHLTTVQKHIRLPHSSLIQDGDRFLFIRDKRRKKPNFTWLILLIACCNNVVRDSDSKEVNFRGFQQNHCMYVMNVCHPRILILCLLDKNVDKFKYFYLT
ncbi:hypothetical protein LSH36_662g03009 [Paralvinella palmiformis]|uniref:Uncharacterized protein n=1 Tax=Paralvinella palmiformis TaxID=53620 RepID=A0AAD9J3I5_9ANNE|nr:hypothetical protein LSH36_662g03009 [Paralvinella palmiformis]